MRPQLAFADIEAGGRLSRFEQDSLLMVWGF
jgi:hypothetical protein